MLKHASQPGCLVYTSLELAHMLRRNERTIRRLAAIGKLPGTRRIGGSYVFLKADVDAFLAPASLREQAAAA